MLAGAFSGVVGGSSVGPAGPGSYPFLPNPPTGTFKAATTAAAQVDATCTAASGASASMSGGSITIASLDTSAVSGTMDLQFDNGQGYSGNFAVPVCPVSIDTCSLFGPCGTHTCVQ